MTDPDGLDADAVHRAAEEQRRLIFECARDYAIFTTDPDGRITTWPPGAETVFAMPAADAIGAPVATTFTPEDRAAGVPERELETARRDGVAPDVRWHQRMDGHRIFIDGTTRALRDGAGRLHGFLKIGQDVTERRRLDEALRASEARYRAIVEHVRDHAIFLLAPDGRIAEWTPGAEQVTGFAAAEVMGRHVAMLHVSEAVEAGDIDVALAEAVRSGRAEREGWRLRRDGTRYWASETVNAIADRNGASIGFVYVQRDLTAQRRAADAADHARAKAERDAVRGHMAAAGERERLRLGLELHDVLGQTLTALSLETKLLEPLVQGAEGAERLARVRALLTVTSVQAHGIARALRPIDLGPHGLETALRAHARDWQERTGVAVDMQLHGPGSDAPLAPESATALYRIAQEALTNVARHARATRVSVTLTHEPDAVRLVIEDDGAGFDAEAALAQGSGAHRLGLVGMRERAALAGGDLEVESSPGAGTTVLARLPLRHEESPES